MLPSRHLITLTACFGSAAANVYDVIMPNYKTTCANGCMKWADVPDFVDPGYNSTTPVTVGSLFRDGKVPDGLGAECAMPASHAGNHECDCGPHAAFNETYMLDSYAGPWCFCKDPTPGDVPTAYCLPPQSTPEQINLQMAESDAVVVGFVTYESGLPADPPTAMFGLAGGEMKKVTGVSHLYAPPGHTSGSDQNASVPYVMSYIKLPTDKPRTKYTYKVKSGGAGAAWSEEFTFRSLYSDGETKVLTYGDLGHSQYNCMQNAKTRCAAGDLDAIVHMGDHAYDMGMIGDRRGDAYMNSMQPALATCPWFPIIGNHESDDGDSYKHYEAMAFGEVAFEGGVFPADGRRALSPFAADDSSTLGAAPSTSTATSALGKFMTKHTMYATAHGNVPSNTSRYASTDIGLLHMVGLDLNKIDDAQLAWLEADLQAVNKNRERTPWIMVMSHFPIYHSKIEAHLDHSLAHYLGDERTDRGAILNSDDHFVPCDRPGCETIGSFQKANNDALQPLFERYGVDIYNAGHVHDYEMTWPLCWNAAASNGTGANTLCDGQQHFADPKGTIHVTEGNGGVPGVPADTAVTNCSTSADSICRMHATGGNYGRWTFYNASTMLYEHVHNVGDGTDDNVTDSWIVTQEKHGPFTGRSKSNRGD